MTLRACVFCRRIFTEQYDEDYSDHRAVSFVPLNPVVEGHRLILPRTHVRDAASSPDITAYTYRLAAAIAKDLKQEFNLITNAGKAATQTVPHLHVHYVPRAPEDGLLLPWSRQYED